MIVFCFLVCPDDTGGIVSTRGQPLSCHLVSVLLHKRATVKSNEAMLPKEASIYHTQHTHILNWFSLSNKSIKLNT